MWAAISRRFVSDYAGVIDLYTPGPSPSPYHPSPKPSPFVVSAPIFECSDWSTSPCCVLNSSSSTSTGCPDHAIQRHMFQLLVAFVRSNARPPTWAERGGAHADRR